MTSRTHLNLVIDLLSVNCLIFTAYKLLVLFFGKTVLVFSNLNSVASALFWGGSCQTHQFCADWLRTLLMMARAKLLQLCPTLCHPMDCSPPGSSVHGISQSRILEWVAVSFSRASSQPRYRTHISCISCICMRVLSCQHHLGSPLRMAVCGVYVERPFPQRSPKTAGPQDLPWKETCSFLTRLAEHRINHLSRIT